MIHIVRMANGLSANRKRKYEEEMDLDEKLELPGEQLTPALAYFSVGDLDCDSQIVSYDALIGCKKFKDRLERLIDFPIEAPNFFLSNEGKRTIRHTFCIFGARGSGKWTLIKAFCKKYYVNLIVIYFASFKPLRDIPKAFQTAQAHQPCIIVFNECEEYFKPEAKQKFIACLSAYLQRVVRQASQIWTIFLSARIPRFDWAIESQMSIPLLDSWMPLPDEAERMEIFRQAISMRGFNSGQSVLHEQQLKELAGLSQNNTFGEINDYVENVFESCLHKFSLEELKSSLPSDMKFVPLWQDFQRMIRRPSPGEQRICDFSPDLSNVDWVFRRDEQRLHFQQTMERI